MMTKKRPIANLNKEEVEMIDFLKDNMELSYSSILKKALCEFYKKTIKSNKNKGDTNS